MKLVLIAVILIAGDAMTYHQDQAWTTVDKDNDVTMSNCALNHHGAWWYKNCHLANINGKWGDTRHSVVSVSRHPAKWSMWILQRGFKKSIKKIRKLMIQKKDCWQSGFPRTHRCLW